MSAGPDADLEALLGHRFADAGLLETALTHPGFGGGRAAHADYERLEFLGDRVLGLEVARRLYARLPEASAGGLAVRYNLLVRRETVAEAAREIGLGAHIRLNPADRQAGTADSPAVLADVFEAIVAALYLDGGADAAGGFVGRLWQARIDAVHDPEKDAKTRLQERLQRGGGALPTYEVVARTGPDHEPEFVVEVQARGRTAARGSGRSRRLAEQAAAAAMLAEIERT